MRKRVTPGLFALAFLAFLPPLVSILAGCGSGGRAYSPDLSNHYLPSVLPAVWDKEVVTYRIDGGDSDIPFVDMPRAVERGFRRWDGVPSSATFRRVHGDAEADIVVGFGTGDQLGRDQGRTVSDVDDTVRPGRYRAARVTILRSLTPGRMEQVSAHEWGHATCGIRGHSDYSGDLMAPTVPSYSRPTQRDYATAVLIQKMLGGP